MAIFGFSSTSTWSWLFSASSLFCKSEEEGFGGFGNDAADNCAESFGIKCRMRTGCAPGGIGRGSCSGKRGLRWGKEISHVYAESLGNALELFVRRIAVSIIDEVTELLLRHPDGRGEGTATHSTLTEQVLDPHAPARERPTSGAFGVSHAVHCTASIVTDQHVNPLFRYG